MADKYKDFAELSRNEREGVDFRISCTKRDSPAAIIAPHGGWIEPGTSEIATAIAGDAHSLYCFEALRNRPHGDLHITSTRFNEPRCVELVAACNQVVAIHGRAGTEKRVDVGGLDTALRDVISGNLVDAGFDAGVVTTGELGALSAANICNRGAHKAGAQLEITRALRDDLVKGSDLRSQFARAVARAL